ncbi:DUF2281 domain-containing protein [Brasilonema sp. UFV-L1]|uniref:DUF2281 domain-containing protein n=1 Tax=Brasilonema sp. UFV-L1 TaxID=2234130 RepID=UPI00145D41FC|nr:DUF2281 domain-containing protein [Brasilonema sp. UFV-L1]NMG11488.1 hypothetical protein [Brasilonema sp. UFV-L1]
MNTKQKIIEQMEEVPEEVLTEVLDFLLFLKTKEDFADVEEDARAALEEADLVGTTSSE